MEANEKCDSGGDDTAGVQRSMGAHWQLAGITINNCRWRTCEVGASGDDLATCNGANAGPVKCREAACGDGYVNSNT